MHSISAESFIRTIIKLFLLEKKCNLQINEKYEFNFKAGNLIKGPNLNKIHHFSFSQDYFRPTKPGGNELGQNQGAKGLS